MEPNYWNALKTWPLQTICAADKIFHTFTKFWKGYHIPLKLKKYSTSYLIVSCRNNLQNFEDAKKGSTTSIILYFPPHVSIIILTIELCIKKKKNSPFVQLLSVLFEYKCKNIFLKNQIFNVWFLLYYKINIKLI
jgi:hypothetical protein